MTDPYRSQRCAAVASLVTAGAVLLAAGCASRPPPRPPPRPAARSTPATPATADAADAADAAGLRA
ncbi:MAG: hypothetical protein ACRDNT_19645, partial [Streptosporangiaceae bacterium]